MTNLQSKLKEIRVRLKAHKWNCSDIYYKWRDYLIDDLLHGNLPLEEIFEGYLQDLKEEIDRDAGIN